MSLHFGIFFSYLASFPDLPPLHVQISLFFDRPLLSHRSISLPRCRSLASFFVPCFKDTGLVKWKASLSLNIMAHSGVTQGVLQSQKKIQPKKIKQLH